jgi:hypothetical protein
MTVDIYRSFYGFRIPSLEPLEESVEGFSSQAIVTQSASGI